MIRRASRVGILAWLVAWVFVLGWAYGVSTRAQAAEAGSGAPPAAAPELQERRGGDPQTRYSRVAKTVMCPSCDTTLDQSSSPAADRMGVWVRAAIDAGWTEDEIRDGLVAEYGGDESILAVPRAQGLGLGIWIAPGFVIFAMLVGGVVLLRRWRAPQVEEESAASSQAATSSSESMSSASSSSSR